MKLTGAQALIKSLEMEEVEVITIWRALTGQVHVINKVRIFELLVLG